MAPGYQSWLWRSTQHMDCCRGGGLSWVREHGMGCGLLGRAGVGVGLGGGRDIWNCLNKSVRNISHRRLGGRHCWFIPLLQRHSFPRWEAILSWLGRQEVRGQDSDWKDWEKAARITWRLAFYPYAPNKLWAASRTSELGVGALMCRAVSGRHTRVKTQMARCNKHGQCFFFCCFFLAHIKDMALVFYFIIALGLQRVQSGSEVGFTRVEGEACFHLVQDTFFCPGNEVR